MRTIWGVARADFRERSRRFSFIAMIALALFAAFWFVPRNVDSMQIMSIQPDRVIQGDNPSWIPVASAFGLGFFLPLIGFFYLRNTITFDEKSGVEQLISSSPVGNSRYLLGKFCSGTLLLYCLVGVVMLGSLFMMLWNFPGQFLSVHDFLSPFVFLLFTLPFCAALAVWFESIRFLRGAFGNILYIVAFFAALTAVTLVEANPGILLRSIDFSGVSFIYSGIGRAVLEQSGQPLDTLLFLGGPGDAVLNPTVRLVFNGIPLSVADLQGFAGMLCITAGVVLLSAPLYKMTKTLSGIKMPKKRRANVAAVDSTPKPLPTYNPVMPTKAYSSFRGITAELRLMLAGQSRVWWLIGLAGVISCVFVDLRVVRLYLQPLLMLWFVNIFSAMGSREYQHDVLKCIAVLLNGRRRQMVSSWLSGVLIAFTLALPLLIRTLLSGELGGVFACVAGIIFLPSVALFLGEFSKTRKIFEVVLVIVTYLILNGVPALLYMGAGSGASLIQAAIYLVMGVTLGTAAVLKRIRS
jgi:hypothetical protein